MPWINKQHYRAARFWKSRDKPQSSSMVPTSFSQSWHGGQGGEILRVGCRKVSDVTEAFRRPRPEAVTADMG